MQIYMAIYGVWISKEGKLDTNTRMGTNDTNRIQTQHQYTNEKQMIESGVRR